MFTIVDNKVYVVENDKMFPVNVSIENGVEKVGQAKDLPKGHQVYTLNEILVKFNIKEETPYYFDKEKYEKELAEKEAEEKAKLEAEIRAKIAEEEAEKKAKEEADKKAKEEAQKEQAKPTGNKSEGDKPNN